MYRVVEGYEIMGKLRKVAENAKSFEKMKKLRKMTKVLILQLPQLYCALNNIYNYIQSPNISSFNYLNLFGESIFS